MAEYRVTILPIQVKARSEEKAIAKAISLITSDPEYYTEQVELAVGEEKVGPWWQRKQSDWERFGV